MERIAPTAYLQQAVRASMACAGTKRPCLNQSRSLRATPSKRLIQSPRIQSLLRMSQWAKTRARMTEMAVEEIEMEVEVEEQGGVEGALGILEAGREEAAEAAVAQGVAQDGEGVEAVVTKTIKAVMEVLQEVVGKVRTREKTTSGIQMMTTMVGGGIRRAMPQRLLALHHSTINHLSNVSTVSLRHPVPVKGVRTTGLSKNNNVQGHAPTLIKP